MPTPRPYRSRDHLQAVIESDAGRIAVQPLRADNVHFDIAWSSHLPENAPGGRNGSHVLDIGRGVQVRGTGNVQRTAQGWHVTHASWSQYPSGRDLTAAQVERACALVGQLVGEWAETHAGDVAQADDVDRNNAARTLEEHIGRHEEAMRILRAELKRCEEGEPFTQYPDLPTKR